MPKKYWLAENGTVRCLNNDCPETCSMSCPIYVQTIALEHLIKNNFSEAARLLRKAVEIEPTFADAWNNLAACCGQMGDHQGAYDAYEKSFNLLAKPNPLYGMAVASKNLRNYIRARDYATSYAMMFGSDGRITALLAEITEKEKSGVLFKKFFGGKGRK